MFGNFSNNGHVPTASAEQVLKKHLPRVSAMASNPSGSIERRYIYTAHSVDWMILGILVWRWLFQNLFQPGFESSIGSCLGFFHKELTKELIIEHNDWMIMWAITSQAHTSSDKHPLRVPQNHSPARLGFSHVVGTWPDCSRGRSWKQFSCFFLWKFPGSAFYRYLSFCLYSTWTQNTPAIFLSKIK